MNEYEFTDEQKEKITELMVNCWGGHMQTGYDIDRDGHPVLWVQLGPEYAKTRFTILPNGKTLERMAG